MRERAKRLRSCRCWPPRAWPDYQVPCHWGHCTEFRCVACKKLRFSAGPVGCKCDGYVRWLFHPGMHNSYTRWDLELDRLVTPRVARKPSKAARDQHGRHNRQRVIR